MSWEESMTAVFEDLEQQAEGLQLAERDLEVADLSAAEYTHIPLAARLHASRNLDLQVRLVNGHRVTGRLARVGEGWFLLVDATTEWIVRTEAVSTIAGLSARADSEETWTVTDRLTLRAVLRRLAASSDACLVWFLDDERLEGRVGRVGRDFFELSVGDGGARTHHVVRLQTVAALQERAS